MKKIAYLECPTGIAGDMCLGALVDGGVPLEYLANQLNRLGIASEYDLRAETVIRQGQRATKVHVQVSGIREQLSERRMGEANSEVENSSVDSAERNPSQQTSDIRHETSGEEHQHEDHHDHGHEHGHKHAHEHHHDHGHAPHRHLPEIQGLIRQAGFPERVEQWSLDIFQNLAIAEATVHGSTPEDVHFHEVGATDALVDIVGTCLGLDWLGIEALYCSPMPTGGGTVKAAHGILPVPVPAVLQLWQQRQVPIYSNGIKKELVTPTGAAIATTLAKEFGEPPMMQLERVALGSGTIDLPLPNLLRLWIGSVETAANLETVMELETQIDDLNPQAIAYACEKLREAGAMDVFTQGIAMKKNRLGTLLTVICPNDLVETCEKIIFTETTTLGIRRQSQSRSILDRRFEIISTPHGDIKIKIGFRGDKIYNVQPEYEDCAAIASKTGQPWQAIAQQAVEQYALE
ncbi:nickel pincer cofactor biosynthesis protein LarC [[Limnothrix rosea] IAM M-220]|uniref:nickel pincer cofactor biosynthesis protein LarC n=1 Tax=[Limnothrix rosea] IAM M-220 TaxID=454133 RepID=UPI00096559F8|nr:nickel pincer cofactor biosynthesis protein LarC [[Limnothrix rosea] IAM M-220]OKH13750.1 TIGR00299 family protein [[Limnothrix rosea] IAM M-220]